MFPSSLDVGEQQAISQALKTLNGVSCAVDSPWAPDALMVSPTDKHNAALPVESVGDLPAATIFPSTPLLFFGDFTS